MSLIAFSEIILPLRELLVSIICWLIKCISLLLAAEVHAGLLCAEFTMNSMPQTSAWPTSIIKAMPRGPSWTQGIIKSSCHTELTSCKPVEAAINKDRMTTRQMCCLLLILQISVYTGAEMTLGFGTVEEQSFPVLCCCADTAFAHSQNNQELLDLCQSGPRSWTIVHCTGCLQPQNTTYLSAVVA